ncbi:uncharacterized protein LOC105201406 [Solenopsis invicta]|uniref:uncharacterized protein LOC105201406 n=1 Tax=Solenopsis invicta TaxID=13686 RepID=UPI0005959C78|nr:uncharacterized protein LOC105201406 [Solenopsis invicta]
MAAQEDTSSTDSEFFDTTKLSQEVDLIIRRKNVTLHLDMRDNVTVNELKKMIEAILHIQPEDQQLFLMFENNEKLDTYREFSNPMACLSEYVHISSPVHPAVVGLAVRQENGSFEKLEITSYSMSNSSKLLSEFPTDDILKKARKIYAKFWR